MELERRVKDWEYWCWKCKNRTYGIVTETPNRMKMGESEDDEKYMSVRIFSCSRCFAPTVLATYTYHNDAKGWGARGLSPFGMGSPLEHVAFQYPGRERDLPSGLPKKVRESFREAEKAVDNRMSVSSAAAIRNTIRLLIESQGHSAEDMKAGIKALDLKDEFQRALTNLKLVGDHTLHYEEYKLEDLSNALEVLHLSLSEYFAAKGRLAALDQAVGTKASERGRATPAA